MIIKLLQKAIVDGKLREKGEIIRVKSFNGEYKVIKSEKDEKKIINLNKEKVKEKQHGNTK